MARSIIQISFLTGLIFSVLLPVVVRADWPPSSDLPESFIVSCNRNTEIHDKFIPGLKEEFNSDISDLSQVIRTMCDPGFASSSQGQQWDHCDSNKPDCETSTKGKSLYYEMTYRKVDPDMKFSQCFAAASAIFKECMGGDKGPYRASGTASILNPLKDQPKDSYTLTIATKLPFPVCTGSDLSGGHEIGSVAVILSNLCGDDVCQGTGEQYGCYRTVAQGMYSITGLRKNWAKNDFGNCRAGFGGIVSRCYQNGKGGGTWGVDADDSQEFYSLSIDELPDFNVEL